MLHSHTALLEPLPDAMTDRWDTLAANFMIWDFPAAAADAQQGVYAG